MIKIIKTRKVQVGNKVDKFKPPKIKESKFPNRVKS